MIDYPRQCFGSKYIEFESESGSMVMNLKFKKNLEGKFFSQIFSSSFFQNYKKLWHQKQFLVRWGSECWIYVYTIQSYTSVVLKLFYRYRTAFTCLDQDPIWIWIRIHNTDHANVDSFLYYPMLGYSLVSAESRLPGLLVAPTTITWPKHKQSSLYIRRNRKQINRIL